MPGCRRYRAMMAASLYEALDKDDRASLETHLDACPVCRKEHAAFQQLLTVLPQTTEPLPHDLVGVMRARIAEGAYPQPAFFWLPAWGAPAFAGACALLLGFSLYFLGPEIGFVGGDNGTASAPSQITAATLVPPVSQVLEEARRLIAANQQDEAATVLRAAVKDAPDAKAAGEAQRALAALTFEHFRLYDVAFQEYMKLRNQFGDVYRQDPVSINRFELLAEEWENNFQALAAVDAARDGAYAEPFRQLESVMASNPGRHVADMALNAMQALVRKDDSGLDSDVNALEAVRARCEDPIAVAQVNLQLGDMYCDTQGNHVRARQLYQEVIDGGTPALAEQAGRALARLELNP